MEETQNLTDEVVVEKVTDEESAEDRLESEGDIAGDYLEDLLNIIDMDGDIEIFVENGRAQVSIDADAPELIGKDGEVLEALQELARLAVMTETGHRSRLMLDIGGHRDSRKSELATLANEAIVEVKDSGKDVELKPMNAFERKVVHDLIADAGLVSESVGEDPRRRVVVKPA